MMDKTIVNHAEIKAWAEKYRGSPEIIDHPNSQGDKVGIRLNFPGSSDEKFFSADTLPRGISWDEFFKIFEEQKLAFMYTDVEKVPDPSYAYRFIKR